MVQKSKKKLRSKRNKVSRIKTHKNRNKNRNKNINKTNIRKTKRISNKNTIRKNKRRKIRKNRKNKKQIGGFFPLILAALPFLYQHGGNVLLENFINYLFHHYFHKDVNVSKTEAGEESAGIFQLGFDTIFGHSDDVNIIEKITLSTQIANGIFRNIHYLLSGPHGIIAFFHDIMIGMYNLLINKLLEQVFTLEILYRLFEILPGGQFSDNESLISKIIDIFKDVCNGIFSTSHFKGSLSDQLKQFAGLLSINGFDDFWGNFLEEVDVKAGGSSTSEVTETMSSGNLRRIKLIIPLKKQFEAIYEWISGGFKGFIIHEIYILMKYLSSTIIEVLFKKKSEVPVEADKIDPIIKTRKIESFLSTKIYSKYLTFDPQKRIIDSDKGLQLKPSELKEMARAAGATQDDMDDADDADDIKAALIGLIEKELSSMKITELKDQAKAAGATQDDMDNVDDAPAPKAAIIALIWAQPSAPARPVTAVERDLEDCKIVLTDLEESIREASEERGLDFQKVEKSVCYQVGWLSDIKEGVDHIDFVGGTESLTSREPEEIPEWVYSHENKVNISNFLQIMGNNPNEHIGVTKVMKFEDEYLDDFNHQYSVNCTSILACGVVSSRLRRRAASVRGRRGGGTAEVLVGGAPKEAEIRIDSLTGRVGYSSLITGKNIYYDGNFCYCRGWFPFEESRFQEYKEHYSHIINKHTGPKVARAHMDYNSGEEQDLILRKGEEIVITGEEGEWATGYLKDTELEVDLAEGWFPLVYVDKIEPWQEILEYFIKKQFYFAPDDDEGNISDKIQGFKNKYFVDVDRIESFEEFIKLYISLLSFVKLMCMFIFYHKGWECGISNEYKVKYLLSFVQKHLNAKLGGEDAHDGNYFSGLIQNHKLGGKMDGSIDGIFNIVCGGGYVMESKSAPSHPEERKEFLEKNIEVGTELLVYSHDLKKYEVATVTNLPPSSTSQFKVVYSPIGKESHNLLYLMEDDNWRIITRKKLDGLSLGGGKFLPFEYMKLIGEEKDWFEPVYDLGLNEQFDEELEGEIYDDEFNRMLDNIDGAKDLCSLLLGDDRQFADILKI